MTYAIIGFGAVGQALAKAFARKGIEVAVASRRGPEALAPQATAIGPTVTPTSLERALASETVILAVPFPQYGEVAKAATSWDGKLVIDATNAYGTPLEQFGGLLFSGRGKGLCRRPFRQGLQPPARREVGSGPKRTRRPTGDLRVWR